MSTPFFIIGCGRSGTTLLRAMLNSHPKVAIPLESLFIVDYLQRQDIDPVIIRELMTKEYEIKAWGLKLYPSDLYDCDTVAEMIEKIHRLYALKHNKVIWGQKTPRFVRYGDLLKKAFPQAKFINLIRDPRAVVSSLISSNVHRSNPYYACRRWNNDVFSGLQLEKKYPESTIRIMYEDLVSKPTETLQRICSFLNLEYDINLLNYHQTTGFEYGSYHSKIHSNLTSAVSTERIAAWRIKLTPRKINYVESVCCGLMSICGYKRETPSTSCQSIFVVTYKTERFFNFPFQLYHYIIHRRKYLSCLLVRKYKLGLLSKFADIINLING